MERQSIGAIPVMLVEEGELFRRGLRTLIEGAGLAVVGEYSSAATVLNDATELEPRTVVLCSLTQPGWQELVRRLLLRSPDCPILGGRG